MAFRPITITDSRGRDNILLTFDTTSGSDHPSNGPHRCKTRNTEHRRDQAVLHTRRRHTCQTYPQPLLPGDRPVRDLPDCNGYVCCQSPCFAVLAASPGCCLVNPCPHLAALSIYLHSAKISHSSPSCTQTTVLQATEVGG